MAACLRETDAYYRTTPFQMSLPTLTYSVPQKDMQKVLSQDCFSLGTREIQGEDSYRNLSKPYVLPFFMTALGNFWWQISQKSRLVWQKAPSLSLIFFNFCWIHSLRHQRWTCLPVPLQLHGAISIFQGYSSAIRHTLHCRPHCEGDSPDLQVSSMIDYFVSKLSTCWSSDPQSTSLTNLVFTYNILNSTFPKRSDCPARSGYPFLNDFTTAQGCADRYYQYFPQIGFFWMSVAERGCIYVAFLPFFVYYRVNLTPPINLNVDMPSELSSKLEKGQNLLYKKNQQRSSFTFFFSRWKKQYISFFGRGSKNCVARNCYRSLQRLDLYQKSQPPGSTIQLVIVSSIISDPYIYLRKIMLNLQKNQIKSITIAKLHLSYLTFTPKLKYFRYC